MEDHREDSYFGRCPNCGKFALIQHDICTRCGFSMVWDPYPPPGEKPYPLPHMLVRVAAFLGALAFVLYFTLYTFSTFEGYSRETIAQLEKTGLVAAPMPVDGPADVVLRVELALTLLHNRAPQYYGRVAAQVASINFVPEGKLAFEGRTLRLTGIAAYTDPSTGDVSLRVPAAYLTGPGELYDRDIFYLAGVLVHEMRHCELARAGLSVGGAAEEYECESTAYQMLKGVGAPRALLQSLEQFLLNPHHPRYRAWERFYGQYEQKR
jgi:hypothetical protein